MLPNSDGRNQESNPPRGFVNASASRAGLDGAGFIRRFRWMIFYTWSVPPVFGLSFILLVDVLTPREILDILLTPLEPLYILGWLAFALWYLPRSMRPLAAWLGALVFHPLRTRGKILPPRPLEYRRNVMHAVSLIAIGTRKYGAIWKNHSACGSSCPPR